MDDVKKPSRLRISLSLSIAFLFHTLIAIFLVKWIHIDKPQPVKIIKVTLKQTESIKQIKSTSGAPNAQQSAPSPESGGPHVISSTSQSSTSVIEDDNPTPVHNEEKSTRNSQPTNAKSPTNNARDTPTPAVKRPKFTTIGDRPSPSSESRSAFAEFNQLFIQRDDIAPLTPQISAVNEDSIAPYKRQLIQKLSQKQFHDNSQYEYSKLKVARSLILEIKLLPSGAIENARIIKSSDDLKLDKAALRAAFLASPYPPPPIEDMKNSYTYPLDIIYAPSLDEAERK